jgi:DivIVA domain-containing protein
VLWVIAIVVVVVIGGVAVVAAGWGGSMAAAYEDRPAVAVPAGRPLRAEDLRDVRFSVGVRGYRMDEVDSLLSRLAEELAERERAERMTTTDPMPPPQPAP